MISVRTIGCLIIFITLSACSTQIAHPQVSIKALMPTASQEMMPDPASERMVSTHSANEDVQVNQTDGMKLVLIPAGYFMMGAAVEQGLAICEKELDHCSMEDYEDEAPIHWVNLGAFWMYQTEVTNFQYQLCVDLGGRRIIKKPEFYQNELFFNHPVVYVDWYSAEAYCAWAGGRLPTEAEWEKAARGQDGRLFPWSGDPKCSYGNIKGCTQGLTAPVGSYSEGTSPFGVLDMAGNVAEWLADWYSPDYYQESALVDPKGPENGEMRVVRGGSWKNPFVGVRVTNRTANYPDVFSTGVGFRCIVDYED
jgi:formylglycine-generating enzyme required for sulfatase activity